MLRAKIGSLAIACMLGCVSLSPVYAFAAETNTESTTLSENTEKQKDKKAAFDEAMKQATEKWNSLSASQKAEVYSLIENEMKAEIKLMDKFVEFGIISKDDATAFTARLMERFSKMKDSGEFPLARPKNSK
jgi:catalase